MRSKFQNTLTHRSGSPKAKIETIWTPPDTFTGNIVFRATIVQTKNVFWTEQDTSVLRFSSGQLVSNKTFLNAEEMEENENGIENSIKMNSETVSQKATQSPSLNYSICSQKFCLGLGSESDCVSSQSCDVLLSGIDSF